jgi:hypothetical protein
MRPTFLVAALLLIAAATSPRPLASQAQQPLGIPLWAEVGVGQASMSHCHGMYLVFCNFVVGRSAQSVYASVGTSSGRALVGVEAGGWRHQRGEAHTTLVSAGALTLVYPLAGRGLNLKGAAGLSSFVLSGQTDDIILAEDHLGAYLTAGLGYDLPVGAGLALTPALEYRYSTFKGRAFRDHAGLLQLGIGVAFNRR